MKPRSAAFFGSCLLVSTGALVTVACGDTPPDSMEPTGGTTGTGGFSGTAGAGNTSGTGGIVGSGGKGGGGGSKQAAA